MALSAAEESGQVARQLSRRPTQGIEAEDRENRRSRSADQNQSRPPVSEGREQGSVHAAVQRPRDGAPGSRPRNIREDQDRTMAGEQDRARRQDGRASHDLGFEDRTQATRRQATWLSAGSGSARRSGTASF